MRSEFQASRGYIERDPVSKKRKRGEGSVPKSLGSNPKSRTVCVCGVVGGQTVAPDLTPSPVVY